MQTNLLDTVVTTLRSPAQLIELLNRASAVLYPTDPSFSNHVRDKVARWWPIFGDLSCIEYEYGALSPNPTLREITDLVFRAYPAIEKEMRVVLTKADQTLGRERFLELLREIEAAAEANGEPETCGIRIECLRLLNDMTKVEALEREVEKLTPEELAAFRDWFVEHDWQVWDRQIERDAAEGRLDEFAAEALAELKRGETKEI